MESIPAAEGNGPAGLDTGEDDAPGSWDTGISGSIGRLLEPILPPSIVDVVMSPLILGEALLGAVFASSQMLLVPGLLLLISLSTRRGRRAWLSSIASSDGPALS